jgi:hypothetical protein
MALYPGAKSDDAPKERELEPTQKFKPACGVPGSEPNTVFLRLTHKFLTACQSGMLHVGMR